MCFLEEVYHACGCWRPSPRVSHQCAAGRTNSHYKNYGCHNSQVVGCIRLEEQCRQCLSRRGAKAATLAGSDADSRRPSAVSSVCSMVESTISTSTAASSVYTQASDSEKGHRDEGKNKELTLVRESRDQLRSLMPWMTDYTLFRLSHAGVLGCADEVVILEGDT